jgi:hypothetical protein
MKYVAIVSDPHNQSESVLEVTPDTTVEQLLSWERSIYAYPLSVHNRGWIYGITIRSVDQLQANRDFKEVK